MGCRWRCRGRRSIRSFGGRRRPCRLSRWPARGGVRGKVAVADAAAARVTRWKPCSWSGGGPEADGSVTYSWATSAPEREPVLVTVAVTVAAPPAVSGPTLRLLNENVVYDRPYPNGNSGVRPLLPYQRSPTPTPSGY